MVNRFSSLERTGGTYRYIDDLCRELAQRGHELHLLCRREKAIGGRNSQELAPNFYLHWFGTRRRDPIRNTWRYMRTIRDWAEELNQQYDFDLVCVHDSQMGYLLKQTKLCHHVPLLYFFYAPVFYEFAYKRRSMRGEKSLMLQMADWPYTEAMTHLQWLVESSVLKQADRIIALSQFSVSQLRDYFNAPLESKTTVIPAGVNIHRFLPTTNRTQIRQELQIPFGATVLFTVRNLEPRMGLPQLIQAISQVKNEQPQEQLLLFIGGRGSLYNQLQEDVKELNLEEVVHLLGYIPDNLLPTYYQASDFFVLPTIALEGFGIVTIEALACNTPVIVTPVGATPEIARKFNGYMASSASPQDMAQIITVALQDKKQGALTHWNSRSLIEADYSWDKIGDRIEELFYAICRDR